MNKWAKTNKQANKQISKQLNMCISKQINKYIRNGMMKKQTETQADR